MRLSCIVISVLEVREPGLRVITGIVQGYSLLWIGSERIYFQFHSAWPASCADLADLFLASDCCLLHSIFWTIAQVIFLNSPTQLCPFIYPQFFGALPLHADAAGKAVPLDSVLTTWISCPVFPSSDYPPSTPATLVYAISPSCPLAAELLLCLECSPPTPAPQFIY